MFKYIVVFISFMIEAYTTPCKKCGVNIYFKKIKEYPLKYLPYNELDGKMHFNTCFKKDVEEMKVETRQKFITCLDCNEKDHTIGHCVDFKRWLAHKAVYGCVRFRRWHPKIDLDHTRKCGCERCKSVTRFFKNRRNDIFELYKFISK